MPLLMFFCNPPSPSQHIREGCMRVPSALPAAATLCSCLVHDSSWARGFAEKTARNCSELLPLHSSS